MAPRAYYHQPVWKRIVVIGAGPAVNIAIALAILFFLFLHYGNYETTQTVGKILPGSPAATALKPGDEIVAFDGKRYRRSRNGGRGLNTSSTTSPRTTAPASRSKAARAATPVTITIRRDGELRTVTVRPEYDAKADRTRIGFSYGEDHVEYGVARRRRSKRSTKRGLSTKGTVSVFARLFQEHQRKQLSGVVGVSDVANEKLDQSTAETLLLVAVVSLSLGLINLFPFLPLDGGHIFWSLVEKVRGRPVPFQVMERAGVIGFVLVIMLFFIGLSNDIGRITRRRLRRPLGALYFCSDHLEAAGRRRRVGHAADHGFDPDPVLAGFSEGAVNGERHALNGLLSTLHWKLAPATEA